MLFRTCLILLCATCFAFGETRVWKSADGTRSVQGEFIKRDASAVTIRTGNGQERIIQLSQLHPDERRWLKLHHPLDGSPDPAAVFDTLTFKDTRDSTLAKLKASKIVEMTAHETFIGRSGLNGVFSTRQKIGDLGASLYFDWTPAGTLKEITLQTETIQAQEYRTRLEPGWKAFVELLSILYGLPEQKGPLPQANSLADGSFMPSHLWLLEGGGSALLGTARDGDKFQLVVRFTQKIAGRVELP
ncbi:MAG: hypothetical protein WED15_04480 [Akkermansiaceae bacterium]